MEAISADGNSLRPPADCSADGTDPHLAGRLVALAAVPVLALIALLSAAIVLVCEGRFVYTLDDPYITLALASNISHGHYGLNPGEAASPSSSILYPFMLAPFSWSRWQYLAPLFLNALAAAGAAALIATMFVHFRIVTSRGDMLRGAALIFMLCLASGIIGVTLTGLEHPFHVLACLAIVYGVALVLEGAATPFWLVLAIVLVPLVRFEGLALATLAIAALAIAGRWPAAAIAAGAIALSLGIFSAAMAKLGLPLLPSSVLIKWADAKLAGDGATGVAAVFRNTVEQISRYPQSVTVFVLMLANLAHPVLRALDAAALRGPHRFTLKSEFILATLVVGALAAHILFGTWGWGYRYEIYAVATGLCGGIVLWHLGIAKIIASKRLAPLLIACAVVALMNPKYINSTFKAVRAARSIYQQQYQMRRFAVDFYRAPVAVNDLGLVSFDNPNYVLDLWGLGSEQARTARLVTREKGWLDALVQSRHVGGAIIYSSWFAKDIPATWRRMAVLKGRDPIVYNGDEEVAFYATSAAAVPRMRESLDRFAAALGPSAILTLDDAAAHQ